MFVVIKKERNVMVDSIRDLMRISKRCGSLEPLTLLFRKGRYGSRGTLKGNYIDYKEYQKRKERRIDFAVVD